MTIPIEVLEERVSNLTAIVGTQNDRIQYLETELKTLEDELQERERKRLVWGISTLGSISLALAGVLWSYRSVIFK